MTNDNLHIKEEISVENIEISSISTGFIEVPTQISLNLYVQGCKMRCKDCQNKDLQQFSGGTTINTQDLPNILKDRDLPTWICWLGGDAVYQPEGFVAFNNIFKEYGYKICLYTGKKFSEIQNILKDVDLVIDGAWEGTKVDDSETNQEVYLKTDEIWSNLSFNDLKERLR